MASSSLSMAISECARSRSASRRVVRRWLVVPEPQARVTAVNATETAWRTLDRTVFVHPRGKGIASWAAMAFSGKVE